MGISKGLVGIDDYIRFGKLFEELSNYAAIITFVPKRNMIIVTTRDEFVKVVVQIMEDNSIGIKEISKGRGIMRFVKGIM